ncbi:hypothetical protein COCON_G00000210 [Conger conger]|uniref:BAAT/Acyl-CoA thioester hydrolase C-terminal domain-containing protein n=1 Tax=Conger conger TaxID=82655 RepID=A0A9Q1E0G0_CONCO|nr:hypothetical protein COCON_G00000210 [Conger conger]
MKAQSDLGRLIRKDITSPFKVLLSVHDKTSCEKDARPLASCIHERGFLGDGVRRIPGRARFRGFWSWGHRGGMLESRACLLANHGFATLCLAYFSYDDLPKRLLDLHLEYFEEALQYFQNVPQVRKGGVGIMGISKGADLALSMASFLPGVRAVVSVNGCNANLQCPLHYGELTLQGLGLDAERIVIRESGVLNRASARFLFVIAQDDQVWDAEVYARQAEEQLLSHGRSRPEILLLPGPGTSWSPLLPLLQRLLPQVCGHLRGVGRGPVSHSAAQEKYWQRIREFFLENLGGAGPSKL